MSVTQKSAIPLYGAAAVWLVCAFAVPFYRLWHILAATVLSVGVFLVLSRIFPGRTVEVKAWEAPQESGDERVDPMLKEGYILLDRLGELDDAIAHPGVSAHIVRIRELGGKILAHVAQNPQKAADARRFLNYYLPTTVKLLEGYRDMSAQGVQGENISGTMARVEDSMATVAKAFEKQLDSLFAGKALDISTDITVLEGMLSREGLTEDGISGGDTPATM